ncbi:MFS transporter, partial [Arthrobacter sp. I3]|uniref:MFS transporter n=1 Tax=Arthrobacter sp. I3 TaxID=218158 RepID=UPI0012EC3682
MSDRWWPGCWRTASVTAGLSGSRAAYSWPPPGTATAAIGFTHQLPWFLLASACAGIGSGLLGPAQQAAIADVIGNERSGGRVLAVFQMASDSGAIVGPVVAGLLADRLGYGWA